MSDSYPEYLNPFAEDEKIKPKLTVRNSFKEFRKSLRQSFRIKKKEDEVILRPKQVNFQRLPIPSTSPPPEALPRFRFRERLSKDQRRDSGTVNPFDEEDNNETKPATVRRRGKKRAPPPPKSISSQHINHDKLEISDGGSSWSLTSVETDYSSSVDCCRDEENPVDANRNSMVETFADFNKNMNALKDDTNNNVITKEEVVEDNKSSCNIPDLVVSCPSESDCDKVQEEHDEKDDDKTAIKENEEKSEIENEEKSEDKKDSDSEDELVVNDITNNMIIDNHIEERQKVEPPELHIENQSEQHNENQPEQHNKNVLEHQIVEESQNQNENDESFLYYEKKSLYIGDSRDELNQSDSYKKEVSLFIRGSCDALDSSNNNKVSNKNIPDENRNDDALPTPKQRKNKLTKNILLGM